MRDQTSQTINESNFNVIVILHPTNCTHWVLVIRRDGGETTKHEQKALFIVLIVLVLRHHC